MVGRRGNYLYRENGRGNWKIRLQPPGEKQVRRSLGTPHRDEAEILAADIIRRHKLSLLKRRANGDVDALVHHNTVPFYEPGEHRQRDGGRIIATPSSVAFYDAQGVLLREERNQKTVHLSYNLTNPIGREAARQKLFTSDDDRASKKDDAIIAAWVELQEVSDTVETTGRTAVRLFTGISGKPLAKATGEDAEAFVRALKEQGKAWNTITGRIKMLRTIWNQGLKRKLLKTANPFVGVTPPKRRGAERKKIAFTSGDMQIMRANLDKLLPNDRLLWLWLAQTGMRMHEPFTVRGEECDEGVRFIRLGSETKTEESERTVPIPDSILPLLPAKIIGPVLPQNKSAVKWASDRLNTWIHDVCGISQKDDFRSDKYPEGRQQKTLHCLRHRAKSRLRALEDEGCPSWVRDELMGHGGKKTEGDKYGEPPIKIMKKWMERI